MANKQPKKKFETILQPDEAVIEFLATGQKQFGGIWNYLEKMKIHYDSKTSLVKLLEKLQHNGTIKKKQVTGKYPLYYLSKDSRLLVEARAIMFKTKLESEFSVNFDDILREMFNVNNIHEENKIILQYTRALVQYFGVYVLFGLISSMVIPIVLKREQKIKKKINYEELQHIWLNRILSLEEGVSASGTFYKMLAELTFFDDYGKWIAPVGSKPTDKALFKSSQRILDSLAKLFPLTTTMAETVFENNEKTIKVIREVMEKDGLDETFINFIQKIRTPVQYGIIKTLNRSPELRDVLLKLSTEEKKN